MENFFNDHGYGILGVVVNIVVGYAVTKTRAEIAELKVWIYQNFQSISKP